MSHLKSTYRSVSGPGEFGHIIFHFERYHTAGVFQQYVPKHGSDNTLPIFTQTLHRSHLNKGCYGMLNTPLKCNLVNFDIPNGFS